MSFLRSLVVLLKFLCLSPTPNNQQRPNPTPYHQQHYIFVSITRSTYTYPQTQIGHILLPFLRAIAAFIASLLSLSPHRFDEELDMLLVALLFLNSPNLLNLLPPHVSQSLFGHPHHLLNL